MSMKNSNDIGNRTRELLACSAVPQPSPRAPLLLLLLLLLLIIIIITTKLLGSVEWLTCSSSRDRSLLRRRKQATRLKHWSQRQMHVEFILSRQVDSLRKATQGNWSNVWEIAQCDDSLYILHLSSSLMSHRSDLLPLD